MTGKATSKMARIVELLRQGCGTAEIADCVGCRRDYVRACRNRSLNLKRYACVMSPRCRAKRAETYRNRYRADPVFRTAELARAKVCRAGAK